MMRHFTACLVLAVLLAGCGSGSVPSGPNTASLASTTAPAIGLSPTSLSFHYYYRSGLVVPASQKLNITNTGGGILNWTAISRRWLQISPQTGTGPSTLTVSVDPAVIGIGINGYRPGILNEPITVTALGASNTPQTITVTLFIHYYSPPAPVITITGSIALLGYSLCYPAIPSSTRPCGSSASLSIANTGGGTLNWTSNKSATWLKRSPNYGTAPSTVRVWVDGTGWPKGTYYGWFKIWATDATNSPQTVRVTMKRY
jgi:trimeric autotransporter adhesin